MEKILLIEDDADIREMLIDYLSGDGYEITAYADGVSVGVFTDITDYSLALVDLMLPKSNGFELIKKIREISTIPIIIITAKNSDHDKSRGLSMGCRAGRPFHEPDLSVNEQKREKSQQKFHCRYQIDIISGIEYLKMLFYLK